MAQIVVRQLPDAVHAALHARARHLGVSAEALARDILAAQLLPETRSRLGDQLAAIWAGADLTGVQVERDPTPAEPPRFE